MTAATKTRRLHAVLDAPVILESVTPVGRRKQLAAERADAARAMNAPEVVEEQQAAVAYALNRLAAAKTGKRQILDELAQAMFALGHMNGAADARNAPYLQLAEKVLTGIGAMETVERDEARAAERAVRLKAVAQ